MNNGFSYLICFTAGVLVALAQPTFFLAPFFVLGLHLLVLQINNTKDNKTILFLGFFFGLGLFSVSFHWLIFSLNMGENIKHLSIPIVLFFISFLSIFFVFSTFVYIVLGKILNKNNIFLDSFIFASSIFAFELLRSKIFGGFPLNLSAHIWGFDYRMFNVVQLIGVESLSFLTILWALLLSKSIIYKKKIFFLLTALAFPTFLFFYGAFNLAIEDKQQYLNIRLVQPNVPQDLKWDQKYTSSNIKKLFELSNAQTTSDEKFDMIIWPESSIPLLIKNTRDLDFLIDSVTSDSLFFGAVRASKDLEKRKLYNSFFYIEKDYSVSFYDKINLVPFGEFVPFKKFIPIKKLTDGYLDFSRGDEFKTITFTNNRGRIINVKPSICYEGIFPLIHESSIPLHLIVNITNDAWFGNTTGPEQHSLATRYRAVENSLPLVRVANTGISGVYDKNGKTLKKLGLDKTGKIDVRLFISKTNQKELYDKTFILISIVFFCFLCCYFADFLKKKS